MGMRRSDEFTRALLRFNAHVLGVTAGAAAAAGLGIATLVLVAHGEPNPGTMLNLLGHFFPGYDVSVGGAFVGVLWAGVAGYVVGSIAGRSYGPWLLRGATQRGAGTDDSRGANVLLLSPLPLALVTGALLAIGFFAAANFLWLRYGYTSPHLALLGHYLPGYRTDFTGSLIGAFWVFVYGCGVAGAVAWIYDRVVLTRSSRSR